MQTGLVILTTAILAVSVTAVPILDSANSRLQIIEVGENTLEVIFYNEQTGIRIRADSTSLTLISMADDEVLLSGSRPHNSSLLSSVMGTSFLEYATTSETGEQRKVEFVVPESLVDQTKKAVEELKEERLINSDETATRTIRETTFQRFFARPELSLLESAAHALGNAGITGRENQGALNFYATTMAVLKQQQHQENAENNEESTEGETQHRDRTSPSKQWLTCLNGWSCPRCPYSPRRNCLGLCGPGCTCWQWVCGDCCYHRGCYDHDRCCKRSFGLSASCLIPIGFTCCRYLHPCAIA